MGIWHALWAPKGTPQPVIDKLAAAVQAAQADPAFRKRMKDLGTVVMDGQGNPEALRARVVRDTAQWKELLQKAGVKPE
jgi:tripartite-type tricarboxylate transporter receptor subunit TctC